MSKMNEEADQRNEHQKSTGKRRLVQNFQEKSSGNVLGIVYQQLHMGRKYTKFEKVLTEEKI